MHIAVIGLSHHNTPVEVRERLSITDETLPSSLKSLMAVQEVQEASILSTCNRLEIYTLLRHADEGIAAMARLLSDFSGLPSKELEPHLFVLHHTEAIDHLLRVAASLDSLVVGEGQILAQVKKMMRLGQEHKSTGPVLGRLLNQAISTGKRVRNETNLAKGAVSISSAAVELAQLKCAQERGEKNLAGLGEEAITVVGCGRMGRLLVQHLAAKGCKALTLVNRTVSRAEVLAKDFPQLTIRCVGLEQLDEELRRASMVFTSTRVKVDMPILTRRRLEQLTSIRRLKLFDIGAPRNIAADVVAVDGVTAYVVDDLKEVVARNKEARQSEVKAAEALVRQDAEDFLTWWDGLEAVPVLNRLRRAMDEMREQELFKALSRMGPDLSAREKNVVEALSKGIINKVLHGPVTRLRGPMERQKRLQQLQVVSELFDLDQVETS